MADRSSPLGPRMFRGVEAHLIAQALVLVINLAVTPKLVAYLGTDGYGVFTLIWTALNYVFLLSMGMGAATQKFTAHHHACGERALLSRILRASLLAHAGAGFVGMALLWAGGGWFSDHVLQTGPAMRSTAASVLFMTALAVPAYFATIFSMDVLSGLQRFRTASVFQVVHWAGPALLAWLLLRRGMSLSAAAAAFAALQWALALSAPWAIRDVLRGGPDPSAGPGRSEGGLRDYFRYSLKNWFSQIVWVLTFQGDRVMIARLLPLSDLGYYSVAASLSQRFNVFCATIGQAAFPLYAELHGTDQEERLRRFYLRSSQLYFYLLLPLTIMGFFLTPQFLTLWLGSDFSILATWPARFLMIGNAAYLACSLPLNLASGRGFPEFGGVLQGGRAALLFALWLALIPRWGMAGAALAFLLAQWISAPVFIGHIHRRLLGLGFRAYWSEACLRPMLAAGALSALCALTHAHISTWAAFIAYGTVGMGVYYSAAYALLDTDAKDALRAWLRKKTQAGRPEGA